MRDFVMYLGDTNYTDDMKWKMLYSFYIDPDDRSIKNVGGIDCSADGLISLSRLHETLGMTTNFCDEYEMYRRFLIFHFPRENGGINASLQGG